MKIKNWTKFNETNTYTYTLLNKNEEQIEIEADDIDDANRKYRELYKKGMDPMLTHMNGELIDWNRPTANFGAMKESKLSDEITTEEKEICLKVYKQYQKECLDSDGDYSLRFDDWLKRK